MTGGDSPPPSRPPLVRPTAAWLAEQQAKRLAYEKQRRRYAQAWHRQLTGLADEPENGEGEGTVTAQGPQQGKPRTRARGKLYDPRQGSFEV